VTDSLVPSMDHLGKASSGPHLILRAVFCKGQSRQTLQNRAADTILQGSMTC